MILYHINLGFPFLDESSELVAEPHPVTARDAAAEPGLQEWMRFQKPTPGYAEQVFYHDLPADKNGWAGIQLTNRPRKLGVRVRFQKATLPNLVQWKMMGQSNYVLESNQPTAGSVGAARSALAARCNSYSRVSNANSK